METNTNTNTTAGALSERAMLVTLRISCWLPGKVDEVISRETADKYKVARHRVRTSKYTVDPKTPSYAAVTAARGALRTRFYWYTLPWAHHGPHILPAVLFGKYADDMRRLTQTFTDCADAFATEFPALCVRSIADSNGLITAADFPANIRDCFGVTTEVLPIPTAADFRVQMSEETAVRVREQMQAGVDAQVREALALAARQPYQRLYQHVTRMVERLANPDTKFHDTIVTGLRDLCAIMPALNLTGDADLAALAQSAEAMVANVDPEHLRTVPAIRARVASDAKALAELLAPRATVNALQATAADQHLASAANIEAQMGAMFFSR